MLHDTNTHLTIEAYSDINSSREYDMAIAWEKARLVQSYLEQNGVDPSQISIISYGRENIVKLSREDRSIKSNIVTYFYYQQGS